MLSRFIKCFAIGLCFGGLLAAAASSNAANLAVTFDAGQYRITDVGNGQQLIEMDDFNFMLTPGKPMLPARAFMVALPPCATVNSVSTIGHGTTLLEGTYHIKPANVLVPTDYDPEMAVRAQREWQTNYDATYSSDQPYPDNAGLFAGTGGLRKYTYATIYYCPFSYQPQSGRLEFTPSVTVTIDYNAGSTDDPKMQKLMRDTKADEQARELFVNFDEAQIWYPPTATSTEQLEDVDILVLYDNALGDAESAWEDTYFVTADVAWVAGNTAGTYPGADFAEKIRNYLIDALASLHFEHLFILGDITGIPMRATYPAPDYHYPGSDYCPLTDYYYADLTGDWDSDNDGYFGEYGQDNVDFTPELHVGRIPFSDSATVHRILESIAEFDFDQGYWKDTALLMGAMIAYANEDNSGYLRTDGAVLIDEMITGILTGFDNNTQYEKAGLNPSTYTCDLPLTHTNAIGEWSSGNFGIVNWYAHGNAYGSSRKWWASDDGDGVPEAAEMSWETFVGTSDAASLSSDKKPLCFGTSCLIGRPDRANLAKGIMYQNGAAAFIAPMAITWSTTGWQDHTDGGAASFNWYYFDYVINSGQRLGAALTSSRIRYANNFLFWSGWTAAANLYDFCLYGNPYTLYQGDAAPCCIIRGDIDHDGSLTPLDAIYFVDYLWRGGPPPPCPAEADCNDDGGVNPLDAAYLVNYFWNGGPAPVPCP